MKTYQLHKAGGSGHVPAYVERCAQWAKATNEICGLIRGLLADGEVTLSEARYFRQWLADRPNLLNDPLVRHLALRVERIFEDGIVSADELLEMKSLFTEYASDDEAPTPLPLDTPMPRLAIARKAHCFTGTFISGTRKWCEEQIVNRGGSIGSVGPRLDVLIIGSKVSGAWANQTYGRKIEAAVGLRETNRRPAIVNEEHWLTFIK